MIRVAILSDLELTRTSYELMLQQLCKCKVVFQVKDNKQLVAQLDQNAVDVVLYCCDSGNEIDLEAIHQLSKDHNNVKVLMVTRYYDNDIFEMALNNHFMGYLKEAASVTELKRVIHQLHKDGYSCHQKLFDDHKEYIKNGKPNSASKNALLIKLTKTERKLMPSFFSDLTATEVSKKHNMKEWAVNKHRSNILEKTGCKKMIGACRLLLETGVLTLEQLLVNLLLIFCLLGSGLDFSEELTSDDCEGNSSYEWVKAG